jgi:RNA polymerase-binding protein DksA
MMTVSFAAAEVRMRLEAERREVLAALTDHDAIDAIRRTPDQIDETTLAADREVITADLERKSQLIRLITTALERLAAGEYGFCVRCGVEIAARRLHSVPWTPHCLRCQEAAEREHCIGSVLWREWIG